MDKATPPMKLTDDQARQIGTFHDMVEDTIRLAGTLCGRASDRLSGRPGCVEFMDLHRACMQFLDHPAMQKLRSMGIPPSMLTMGAARAKKEGGDNG